jgi:hypothetical protein
VGLREVRPIKNKISLTCAILAVAVTAALLDVIKDTIDSNSIAMRHRDIVPVRKKQDKWHKTKKNKRSTKERERERERTKTNTIKQQKDKRAK